MGVAVGEGRRAAHGCQQDASVLPGGHRFSGDLLGALRCVRHHRLQYDSCTLLCPRGKLICLLFVKEETILGDLEASLLVTPTSSVAWQSLEESVSFP